MAQVVTILFTICCNNLVTTGLIFLFSFLPELVTSSSRLVDNLGQAGAITELPSLKLKPIFHLATLFVRREAKTRIRQRDCLKLAGEKIRREQVGSVSTFLSVRANKVAKWKVGLNWRSSALISSTFPLFLLALLHLICQECTEI